MSLIGNILVNSPDRYKIVISSGDTFIYLFYTSQEISASQNRNSEFVYANGSIQPLYINKLEVSYTGSLNIQDGEYRAMILASKLLLGNSAIQSIIDFPSNTNIIITNLWNLSVEKYTNCTFTTSSKTIERSSTETIQKLQFISTGYTQLI